MHTIAALVRRLRLRDLCFTVLVFLILLLPLRRGLPAAAQLLQPSAGPLTITALVKNLPDFPPAFTRLFNDNFWGRDRLIRAYTRFRLVALGEKVFPTALVGREGWLFWTGEGSLEDYQNALPFSDADLALIQAKLDALHAHYRARGITFLVVVPPNKTTLYPEYLPDWLHKINPDSRLDRLVAYMRAHGQTPIVDVRPALFAARQQRQVYHATDTHWNDYGAWVAYTAVLNALQPAFPTLTPHPLDAFEPITEPVVGDLARLLFAADLFPEQGVRLEPRFTREARFVPTDVPDRAISVHPDARLPRLVMFRDSFAIALIPFLSDHFSRAVYQWNFEIDQNLIASEQPDIVIYEITERYLIKLLRSNIP